MSIDNDIITLLSLVIMAVMSFYLYRSVPKDVADKLMAKGEEAAAKSPQKWDDDALKLLRTVYDLLQANRPADPPDAEKKVVG